MVRDWSERSEPEKSKSKPVRDALAAVNPIVVGVYAVHVLAIVVLYVSAIIELSSVFIPTVGVAILTTVELLAVVKYLEKQEALKRNFEREKSQGRTGTGTVKSGPFVRAASGSEGNDGQS